MNVRMVRFSLTGTKQKYGQTNAIPDYFLISIEIAPKLKGYFHGSKPHARHNSSLIMDKSREVLCLS